MLALRRLDALVYRRDYKPAVTVCQAEIKVPWQFPVRRFSLLGVNQARLRTLGCTSGQLSVSCRSGRFFSGFTKNA
jgi:hypothetical protein